MFTSIDNGEAQAFARSANQDGEKAIHEVVKTSKDFETTEEFVEHYFADAPVMSRVAWCESKHKHYENDGRTVLRGRLTPADVGVMQINEYYHLEPSRKLGFDIHTVEGNVAYARYLYETEGVQPWSASKHCWSSDHIAYR